MKHLQATLAILVIMAMSSCRKDLCYDHDSHSLSVKVDAAFAWEQEWEIPYDHNWIEKWEYEWGFAYDHLRPDPATGVRMINYAAENKFTESNIPASGGRLPLNEGTSSLLFYNNDTEYILFNNLSAIASASATTRTLSRGNFVKPHSSERTMNQPDMLYGHYIESYEAKRTLEAKKLPVEMKPLVFKYLVRYEFSKGMQYVALARGALAGMAENVFLKNGHTGNNAATILYDCKVKPFGADAIITTFGVPNYPGDHYTRGDVPTPARFTLNLEVRLKNGNFKTFEFDVTEQLLQQPRGGVIIVNGIQISDDEGQAGGGAFNPDVDNWGDFIDIPLPI